MSRVLTVVAILALAAGVAAARAGRRGKHGGKKGRVVRVERSQGGRPMVPRLCTSVQSDGVISCWGHSVDAGEVGTVYSDQGKLADIRIDTVTPQNDSCNNTTTWLLTSTPVRGNLDQVSYTTYAVFDWKGGDQTRVIYNNGQIPAPGNKLNETVLAALDDDGDNNADLIVTYYQCDATGQPVQYGYGGGAYCLSYYRHEVAQSYIELRTDIVKSC